MNHICNPILLFKSTIKYIFNNKNNLRKFYMLSMMKPALADYIIHKIYNYRRLYLISYFFSMVLTSTIIKVLSSYFTIETLHVTTLSSYSLGVNLLSSTFIMLNLLSFTNSSKKKKYPDDIGGADNIEDFSCSGPRIAAYIRVSSTKQAKEGVSLDVQRDEVEEMKRQYNPSKIYWFEDAGKTGMTFNDRKIKYIQKLAESGHIDELWVTQIDRIGRECKKLLIYCLKLCDDGVVIRTPTKQYQLGDLTDLLGLFLQAHGAEEENRKRSERAVASKARNFKMKLWNRPVPLGYEKSGDWIMKQQDWTPLILDVYRLFLLHKKISVVCNEINGKYRLLIRDNKLTRYRIRRILSDPVYMGKPEHLGQSVIDPSLQFVDEKSYSKTLMQIESIKTRHMRKGEGVNELVEKYGISVFAFLEQVELRHSTCGGKLVRNGTRIIDGIKRYTYLCKRCRDQFWMPTKSQLRRIITHLPIKELSTNQSALFASNNVNNLKNPMETSRKDGKMKRLNSVKLSDFWDIP